MHTPETLRFTHLDSPNPIDISLGGTFVPFDQGEEVTLDGLRTRIQVYIAEGLGDDFMGSIRVAPLLPRDIAQEIGSLLLFPLMNGAGTHDIQVQIARQQR